MVILAAFAGHSECFLGVWIWTFFTDAWFCWRLRPLGGTIARKSADACQNRASFQGAWQQLWWSLLPQPRSRLELRKQSEKKKGSSSKSSQNHSVLWWNKTSLLSQIFGPFWHQKNARQSLSFRNITWAFAVQSKMARLSLPSTRHQSTKKFSRSQASSTTRSKQHRELCIPTPHSWCIQHTQPKTEANIQSTTGCRYAQTEVEEGHTGPQ